MPHKDRGRRLAYSKEYNKIWCPQHKQEVMQRSKSDQQEIRAWYREYKNQLRCIVCGESHPACLQFHHRNKEEKDFNVADMAGRASSKKRLINEIQKCDVLCVNCHAKLHWREAHGTDSWEEIMPQGQ